MAASASDVGAPAGRGLLGYSPALVPEIVAFQRAAYPARDPELIEPRWRWMFEQSAARLHVTPMVWVYRAAAGVVAHQGAIAVRCKLGNAVRTTGWFVETMVLERYRGRAVGPMLVKKALEDLPFNLSLGQTEQMREMQFALGWVQVTPLPQTVLPLRPSRVLAGKGPALFRPAVVLALSVQQAVRRALTGVRGFDHEEGEAIGGEHDELWDRVAKDVDAAVVRDASFLRWQYEDQPGQRFVRINVRRGSTLTGFVAFAMRDAGPVYRYRRAIVTDIIAPPSDDAAVRAALRALEDAARRHGADSIVVDLHQPAIQAALRRRGYLSRPAERVFLIAPGAESESAREWTTRPAAWLLSASDSDINRPW